MDTRVMELRIKQWIPLTEEQAKSGISKDEWCTTQVSLVEMEGSAKRCAGDLAACDRSPISIRYGGFTIDLGSDIDAKQLSTLLRVIKYAD